MSKTTCYKLNENDEYKKQKEKLNLMGSCATIKRQRVNA